MFGKKSMSEQEKKAKLKALKEAHGMASGMMKEGLDGAKKVSVMADSKEGLEKGLDVAKKIVDRGDLGEQEDDDMELSGEESEEQEDMEESQEDAMPMDEEDLDKEIQRLVELKAKLRG
jgi:hypothetical protein